MCCRGAQYTAQCSVGAVLLGEDPQGWLLCIGRAWVLDGAREAMPATSVGLSPMLVALAG